MLDAEKIDCNESFCRPSRRDLLSIAGGGAVLVMSSIDAAHAQAPGPGGPPSFGPTLPAHVRGATAITEVFGDGQKMTAIAIGFDATIDSTSLNPFSFAVDGRTITRAYANTEGAPSQAAQNGRFVILELSPADTEAATFKSTGREMVRRGATAVVRQVASITTTEGAIYDPSNTPIPTTSTANRIVDEFDQAFYSDPNTGDAVQYNLFVPRGYEPSKSYPLVLFMHDAGVTSTEVETTLIQGLGAVIWARPDQQKKQESFVLAPQFSVQVAGDDSQDSSWVQTIVDLIHDVTSRYNIDANRIYATGQSGGAMLSLAIMIRHPELFAASFIVAGQWDPSKVAPLASSRQWIVVSEGDAKAFPTQNAMITVYESLGTKVSKGTWSGNSTSDQFAKEVEAMASEAAPINYTVLEKGTVVPFGQSDDPGSNHINTWRIAYTIEGIRDWLFAQRKSP